MFQALKSLFAPAQLYRGAPHPDCKGVGAVPETLDGAEPFIYRRIGARDLKLHVFASREHQDRRPALLYYFGGAFRGGDAGEFAAQARLFAAHGYVAVCADYRVLCRDHVTPSAGVEDAQAAYMWLRNNAEQLGIDVQRVALGGASAGGLLAVSVALRARAKPAALLLFNPVTDVRTGQFNYGMPARRAAMISPAAGPLTSLPPTLILHGEADTVVPIKAARDFQARANAAGRVCELVAFDKLGHSFFQRRDTPAHMDASPFDDTLRRAFSFLDGVLA